MPTPDARFIAVVIFAAVILAAASAATAPAGEPAPSSSLMLRGAARTSEPAVEAPPHQLLSSSMFAVAPEQPRSFLEHDLIQIIVRETSRAESKHELETSKDYMLDGKISAWPQLRLEDILELQLYAGRTTDLPEVKVDLAKEFEGEGDYKREDDLTARLTAEVIEILPNGNLVLEARTHIKTDAEEATIKVTGICRPQDVTPDNTLLSNLVHDLAIEKVHRGELKKANEKGILANILDLLFAF